MNKMGHSYPRPTLPSNYLNTHSSMIETYRKPYKQTKKKDKYNVFIGAIVAQG